MADVAAVEVIARLVQDSEIQKIWVNFSKKVLKFDLDFELVVNTLIDFILPPFQAMIHENEFIMEWDYKEGKYKAGAAGS